MPTTLALHEVVHGHVDVDRFHVRGFKKQGTTTTPSIWSPSTA
jgi:phosphoketolase